MTQIKLATFDPEDIPQLLQWVDTRELLLSWSGGFFRFPLDVAQCQDYWQTAQGNNPQRLIFKAIKINSGQAVGHIELDGFDHENQSAFISRVLVGAKDARGQGIGMSMVNELVALAFTQLKLHRLAVGVLDFNQVAIRCYEKCGFQYEGCYRDLVKAENRYYSVVTMSLLDDEWRQQGNR